MCSEGLAQRPRTPQMAHMDRMIIVQVWGMRDEQTSKRALEKISNKAPWEPMDAMCQMGLKWLLELLHARTRPGSGCLSIVKLSRHHLAWWDNRSFTDPTRSPGPVPRYPLLSVAFLTAWCAVQLENAFGGLHTCRVGGRLVGI